MSHTPTPWEAVEGRIRHNGSTIGGFDQVNRKREVLPQFANAAHAVKCVNAHDELVAALNFVISASEVTVAGKTLAPHEGIETGFKLMNALQAARIILAKVQS